MSTLRRRGTCPACGRPGLALTDDGEVWRHDDPSHRRLDGAPVSCRGSWTRAVGVEASGGAGGSAQLALLPLAAVIPPAPAAASAEPGGHAPAAGGEDPAGTMPLFESGPDEL